MIIASIAAVRARELISSLIALSTVGLGLTLAFLILKAPNLAMTQLVVEILCVVILIRSTINKDLPLVKDGRWLFNTAATLLFIACFLLFAYFALKELPVFGHPIVKLAGSYIQNGFKQTGISNIVSAITLDFRAFDALAEAAIIFTAIMAALAISRKVGRLHEDK
jgi:multisubunit Na+/H+ antiporter MnhB subunit